MSDENGGDDGRFFSRARWIWVVIILGFITVAALELLGVRPK
ncbi:hypothetical protein [Planomonospora venezuelensis]|uniref:Uncharacterized protein n=1 Tax=Planomonospora venezuelensis TaxID=1999 RepID=A0A841DAC2_PLAVE|nr:hypothetical protein [Planomonospora venezuelensis]MBB5965793.1 hypothetical protein [Planomonospora venezuelensis]GIN03986.1 hypothetical protein Pve01_56440 [Planomonospora venezuelensis]